MNDKLILGTVQFGIPYGINNKTGQVSKADAFEILDYAWSRGIKYLDTAAGYGDSEAVLGEFHLKNPDKDFQIITKFDSSLNCEDSLLKSLEKLKSSKVDSVLFHSFRQYTEVMNTVGNFIKTYKGISFNKIGVSVYTNDEIVQVGNRKDVEIVQMPFNLFDNESQRAKVLKDLKDKGKTIHTRSVFLQGLFFMDESQIPPRLSDLKKPLLKIREICNADKLDIGHLALQYSLSKNFIDGVLIGVDSVAQLKQNIQWAETPIHQSIFEAIDEIHIENIDLLNPAKW